MYAPHHTELIKHLDMTFSDLKRHRVNHEWQWQDVAKFICPERGDFIVQNTPGTPRRKHMLDSTAEWASDNLVSFLYGSLNNPASRWFELNTYDKTLLQNYNVRAYLQYATSYLYSIINQRQRKFYDNVHQLYSDIVPFGTGVQFLEDRPGIGLSFRTRFLGECFIDEDYDGTVDVCYRCFDLTVRQVAQQFGTDYFDTKLEGLLEKEPQRKVKVVHAIFPRDSDHIKEITPGINRPYASIYWIQEYKCIVRESGFSRFPVLAPRWQVLSGNVYGRGPGIKALAESRMIQQMKITTLKGGQKTVDPPIKAPDRSFMAPLNMTPGAVNFYNPLAAGDVGPIQTNSRPDYGIELMQLEQEAIKRNFYVDKLQDQKNPNVEQTGREFAGNEAARLVQLSPQLGRMHSEYIGPVLEQIYFVEQRTGRMAPPPEELRNQPLMVQYISPLAKAQQLQELNNVRGAVQEVAQLAPVSPEVMDGIDPAAFGQWVFMTYNTPTDILRSPEEIQQIREQRQQAQEMQQTLEAAEKGSNALSNVASINQGRNRASA